MSLGKCKACDGTGKAGMYTFHKCYRCGGTGKDKRRNKRGNK